MLTIVGLKEQQQTHVKTLIKKLKKSVFHFVKQPKTIPKLEIE